MADNTEFDSRPNQIPKEIQGSDSSIPLSPQWLLPKPGENKTGVVSGENYVTPHPGQENRPDAMKLVGTGDEFKKKDVFRPSVLDMESGRPDRWRDEERDTNSSVRKDRWREGEREHSDNRKVDRKVDSSVRHYGEARRAPGERWTDSGNGDNHDQRRESKWNTRWGPDDKRTDVVHERWGDSSKEDDVLLDKGSSHIPLHGKDEREGGHYRPWRPNSSYSRGRADPHHQTSSLNKQGPMFPHGRGRGENPASSFTPGRGRVTSGGSSVTHTATSLQSHGPIVEKGESGNGEPYHLNYSRTKLIDIYRTVDMISYAKYLEGIVEVPSLTSEEPVQPLAFCAPTPEELVTLKGIDKGEIITGAPQASKEGSAGRPTTDFMHSRKNRPGSKDDIPVSLDDSKHETLGYQDGYSDGHSHEKQPYGWLNAKAEKMQDYQAFRDQKLNAEASKEDSVHKKNDDVSAPRESSRSNSSVLHSGAWRSSSFAERSRLTSDWREVSDDPAMRRQPAEAIDREIEPHKVSQPAPEDLVLYYKDPQGEIQGPFAGSDIITWFESGYFGIELLVRLASAPADSPFSVLGDVMPHLRAKARPPPGFSTPKTNDVQDVSGKLSHGAFGKLHVGSSENDMLKNDPRFKHGNATEAENRFLESLMAGRMSAASLDKFAIPEGMQGYGGNSSFATPPLGSNSGDDPYLLAKKLALEKQGSLPNPYSLWPGRDAASAAAKTDALNETSLAQLKLLSSLTDNSRAQHHSQTVESMPMHQGLSDRSTANLNNGTSGWLNFPIQGGFSPHQDKLDIHQSQNLPPQSAFGINQQRLQPQNTSLTNMLAQSMGNQTHMLTPEKLLASGIPQDPQLLSLLQQQYLLQLQSPTPVASQQLSLLDMLLRQQQQQQEEQQQLMRQQQQLLSRVLPDHHLNQRLNEGSLAQLQSGGFAAGNANVDHTPFQQTQNSFQIGTHLQVPSLRGENANVADFILPRESQDIGPNINSETSMHLPHQFFANNAKQTKWDTTLPEEIVEQQKSSYSKTDGIDSDLLSERATKHAGEQTSNYDESFRVSTTKIFPAGEYLGESVSHQQPTVGHENELFFDTVEGLAETSVGAFEEPKDVELHTGDSSLVKEVKNLEAREVKKSSEKKSKKQKATKVSTDSVRSVSKSQLSKSSEVEETNSGNTKFERHSSQGEALAASLTSKEKKNKTDKVADDVGFVQGQNSSPDLAYADAGLHVETKDQPGQVSYASQMNIQTQAVQRAWKPAPGFKPKSLLEIQQEEQRRAREEVAVAEISTSVSSMNVSTPWAGVVNADHMAFSEILQDAGSTDLKSAKADSSSILKNKNSQKEELFWDYTAPKLGDKEMEISNTVPAISLTSIMSSQTDSVVDDFIDAKDTKKNRKKAAKAKNAGAKAAPVASVETSFGSSPIEKGKNARQMQQQKEVLPAVPSGPSFGDFVTWKGEPASPPAPAWSTDSGKPYKATSLRDILKEQERKVSSPAQLPTPQKPAANQPAHGSGPLWSSSSSTAKAASPIPIISQAASHVKHKVDDDLFWGPLEQPKSENKQHDFPELGKQNSWGSKTTPVKGALGGSLKKSSVGSRPADYSLSASASSGQSSLKGKKNAPPKHSDALDFKEWCESECVRLLGSKDTSILEYCLKISRSEAETLLTENLGSFDPNHEFIDKFLNYKDFLPSNVLDIAFKNQNERKSTASGAGNMTSGHVDVGGSEPNDGDAATKGGKKKGKKGKKMSPLVLGFNVVSNRIMMGEIQTVDD
ncbi:hypothetical protein ABFS82_03G057600 [Erythranthe guttata]|uniref:uncharacterized protein LOC105965902 n=1 Tax=Erythranthe guttata TaxID=4155 RepID=UPI00064DF223|nr:PREDICTED: uncharacterized protein LOC105965902 [Erythranthe guttata]|eukprot:XP_012845904.1 PREDICTED: uncharacterized protein LOC105965902 [Erythranthe guttata]